LRDFGFEFTKRSQQFVRTHNETLGTVAAIAVSNPDCAAFTIQG
jgi:hypothetical protein